ncbi:hypothetical protein DFQ27_004359 [Actinomortierella ambigua]|uniref:non-specific serine/threonine protein kinase n=1 Tax=Actinomortierella ambigua TaxID=1343610 RepID=A0A9P6Q5M7_9FUNG|nr:hypothetical protein DFQ27_004359 [Actinomortierella ambigua]
MDASATAPQKQNRPFNDMVNNDMNAPATAPHTTRSAKRFPGPDSSNANIQGQKQGWVGVQYYNNLQLGQDDDADEPMSPQTNGETCLAQPPIVQHASVPLDRKRRTSVVVGAQDHGRAHHHITELDRHTAAEKRSSKSLAALFEKEAVGGDYQPDQNSSQAHGNMDPRYQYHHQLQSYPHPHPPQESAPLSLLRRREKRPLTNSPSARDDERALTGAPATKRGRASAHGDQRLPVASHAAAKDKDRRVDNSFQHPQNASSTAAPNTNLSYGTICPTFQSLESPVAPPEDAFSRADQRIPKHQGMTTRNASSKPSTQRNDQEHPQQVQEEVADHIQHERQNDHCHVNSTQRHSNERTTPLPQDQDQLQEHDMVDEREAEDVMMDVDANEDVQSDIIEQEQIQNEIRVFERTFPGLSDQYKVLDKIGEGTFSYVYKAIDLKYHEYSNSYWDYGLDKKPYRMCYGRDYTEDSSQAEVPGKVVAIKRITVASSPQRLESEISILKQLTGSKNVAPLITAFRHRDQVIVVLPFYAHDEYRMYFRRLAMDDIRWYFRALFSALAHIHKYGIIHRDIKPTNFLYDTVRKTGILVDFGLAQREDQFEPYHYPSKYKSSVPPVAPSTPAAASAGGVAGGGLPDATGSHQPLQGVLPGGGQGTAPVDLLRPNKHHSQQQPQQQQPLQPAASLTTTATSLSSNREPGFLRHDPRPTIKVNRAGTRGFRSPEILFRHVKQTVALDVWAAGAILISFLSGRFPFFYAIEDSDALIELAVLYGNIEMKKVAASFNRTFVTTVPTVREEGVPFLRVCRLMHPARFGVPWWFDTKLPLKVQKAACLRNVTHLRSQLDKMVAQLKGRDGGRASQKEKESQAQQSPSSGSSRNQQQPTSRSETSVTAGKENSSTAPGATVTPPPPLSQEQKLALQEMIIATKTKINDISQMYNLICRHQQKFHSSTEPKRASSSSQKPSSTSTHQGTPDAGATTADTTMAVPTKGAKEDGPSHPQKDRVQQPQDEPSALLKAAADQIVKDETSQYSVSAPIATNSPMDTSNRTVKAPSFVATAQAPKQAQADNDPRPSHSMQPPPPQDAARPQQQLPFKTRVLPPPSLSHRQQTTTSSNPKALGAALPSLASFSLKANSSSSSGNSGNGNGSSDRAYDFGWDSQEGLEDAVDLLQKLLCLDPTKRITAEQALQHKFLATYTPQQLKTYRAFKEDFFRQEKEKQLKEQAATDATNKPEENKEQAAPAAQDG